MYRRPTQRQRPRRGSILVSSSSIESHRLFGHTVLDMTWQESAVTADVRLVLGLCPAGLDALTGSIDGICSIESVPNSSCRDQGACRQSCIYTSIRIIR